MLHGKTREEEEPEVAVWQRHRTRLGEIFAEFCAAEPPFDPQCMTRGRFVRMMKDCCGVSSVGISAAETEVAFEAAVSATPKKAAAKGRGRMMCFEQFMCALGKLGQKLGSEKGLKEFIEERLLKLSTAASIRIDKSAKDKTLTAYMSMLKEMQLSEFLDGLHAALSQRLQSYASAEDVFTFQDALRLFAGLGLCPAVVSRTRLGEVFYTLADIFQKSGQSASTAPTVNSHMLLEGLCLCIPVSKTPQGGTIGRLAAALQKLDKTAATDPDMLGVAVEFVKSQHPGPGKGKGFYELLGEVPDNNSAA